MLYNPIVKINIGDKEEISKLYGVGPELAQRIIDYRESKGYFREPDDLTRVNGIGHRLAVTLAPHIDWQLPDEGKSSKVRDWRGGLISFVLILAMAIMTFDAFNPSNVSPTMFLWPKVWSTVSYMLIHLFGLLFFFSWLIFDLCQNIIHAKWAGRIAISFLGMLMLTTLSLGISNFFYYQLYDPVAWQPILRQPESLILTSSTFIFASFIIFPNIIVVIWPNIRHNRTISLIFDYTIVLGGPIYAYSIFININVMSLWLIILNAFFGTLFIYLGIIYLMTNKSLFEISVSGFLNHIVSMQSKEDLAWQAWINVRLPDPNQQKALKNALDEIYPRSKSRTLVGFLILVVGGWLVLNILAAILQFFVQKAIQDAL